MKKLSEAVALHCEAVKSEARWLQNWLHESTAGKALPEVDRASIGVALSRLFQSASGGGRLRGAVQNEAGQTPPPSAVARRKEWRKLVGNASPVAAAKGGAQ